MNTLQKSDRFLLFTSILLIGFGLVFVYSSSFAVAAERFSGSSHFLSRQAQRAAMGIVGLFILMHFDYHKIGKLSSMFYLIAVGLLVWVLVGGVTINGAQRWVDIGPLRMQVSEVGRLALVLVLANQLSRMSAKQMQDIKELSVVLVEVAIVVLLVAKEPDFSSSALIGMIAISIIFAAGMRWKHLLIILLIGTLLSAFYIGSAQYRRDRIIGMFKSKENSQTLDYQSQQALLAIGNGGIVGAGLGKSVQKQHFLPEGHTDFVFSILAEELGFIWLLILLAAYVLLILRGFRVAKYAPDRLGQLMAFGLTMLIAVNVMIHTAVNLALVPTTGIPLPFISYGGMSLIFTATGMGIILNISSQCNYPEGGKV